MLDHQAGCSDSSSSSAFSGKRPQAQICSPNCQMAGPDGALAVALALALPRARRRSGGGAAGVVGGTACTAGAAAQRTAREAGTYLCLGIAHQTYGALQTPQHASPTASSH